MPHHQFLQSEIIHEYDSPSSAMFTMGEQDQTILGGAT